MSTYYYLACDTHSIRSSIVGGRSFPHRWWADPDHGALADFMEDHAECEPSPRLVSEYRLGFYEYAEQISAHETAHKHREAA